MKPTKKTRKKTVAAKKRKMFLEKTPAHAHHRHIRMIPWTMGALAVFYLVSLLGIISFFPEVFSTPNSFAKRNNAEKSTETLREGRLKNTFDTASEKLNSLENIVISPEKYENITGDTKTQEEVKREIADIAPKMKFIDKKDSDVFHGDEILSASVPLAQKIHFFLIKKESLTEQYLGSAKKIKDDIWKHKFSTLNIPNGKYKLLGKITNQFGTYESDPLTIEIFNKSTEQENATSSKSSTAESTKIKDESAEKKNGSVQNQNMEEVRKKIVDRSQKQKEKEQNDQADEKTGQTVQKEQNDQVDQKSQIAQNKKNATVAGQLSKSIDSDLDGVSDEEEKRVGTDANSADTDKDGYPDGDEIKKGYNPLKSASDSSGKIVFESPKEKGVIRTELMSIASVEMKNDNQEEKETKKEKKLVLQGKGLPNSFVTLYIYSETPTIITVMTDENGNWTYEMDKDIQNGQHEAYVAITDNSGHITAKSEPFFFVKTAQAATQNSPEEKSLQNAIANQSPVTVSGTKHMLVVGTIIIISLFTSIGCIGLYLVYRYHYKNDPVIHYNYLIEK